MQPLDEQKQHAFTSRKDSKMKPHPRIRLIIRADDSGLCESVNTAVATAFTQGMVRNTSVQVPPPAFADAAERFRSLKGLCIGLHATISAEFETPRWGPLLPAARVPSLVNDVGLFPRDYAQAQPDEIMAEVREQLVRARAAGLPISYIDEHCCFGWLQNGEVRQRMVKLAEEEGLVYDSMAIGWLPTVEGAFPNPAAALIAQLDAAPRGIYRLFLHLGMDRPDMQSLCYRDNPDCLPGMVAREREADFRLCTDPALMTYAATHDVEFISFADLTPAERHGFTHGKLPP